MELGELAVYPVEIATDGSASVATVPIDSALYTVDLIEDNAGFRLSFESAIDGQAYQIKYDTKILGSQGTGIVDNDGTVSNTVTTGTGKKDGSSGTWGQHGIIKNHEGNNVQDKEIYWSIQLNQNSYLMENLVLNDTFAGDGLTLKENTENDLGYELKIMDSDQEFTDYDLAYTAPDLDVDPTVPGGFEITFTEPIDKPLTLTYTTHFERNSDGSATYGNTAGINWSEGGEEYEIGTGNIPTTPAGHTGKNGVKSGSYNAVDKQITWEVNTNYARLPIGNSYTITDTIPENQEYISESLEVYTYDVTTSNGVITHGETLNEDVDYTVTYPTDGSDKLIVTLSGTYAGKLTPIGMRFKTEFADEWIQDPKVNNTVTVNSDGDSFDLEASVEVPFGGKYAEKSGAIKGQFNDQVDWRIILNPNRSRISNYTLTDRPDLNSVLIEDSFAVYGANVAANGNVTADTSNELVEGTDYHLNITTNNETGQQEFVLSFVREISEAYVLNYSSHVDMLTPQGEAISNDYTVTGETTVTFENSTTYSELKKVGAGGGSGSSIRGGLEINKKDKEGNNLAGATFELYSKDGKQLLRTGTTNSVGELKLGGLRGGTYLLKEVVAPNRYVISDELAQGVEIALTHSENGEFTLFTASNSLTEVNINKRDTAGNLINDSAVFNLYRSSDDSLVEQGLETTNGRIIIEDLDPGDYYLVETAAPTGYIRNTARILFTVAINDDGTQTVPNINVINYRGIAEFTKVDELGATIEGATFRVETTRGEVVASGLTSNDEGIIRVEGLAPGNYRLVETVAPGGYIRNTEEIPFNIPNAVQGEPQVFSLGNFTNYQGKVRLNKTDNAGNPLANAIFEIRNKANEVVREELTTGADGRLLVLDLAPGDYTFVEVSAPAGYILDTTPKPFTISTSAEGEPNVVSVGNAINYQGSVVLEKTDTAGNMLTDADFALYEELENGSRILLETYTSDSKGLIEVDSLAPGNYVFVETKAPASYLINEKEIKFTIDAEANGTPEQVTAGPAINYQGSVELTKTDVDGEPLAGAIFKIIDEDGNTVRPGLTSDADGVITATDLAPGNYEFVEIEAPTGYILNETAIGFEILGTADGEPLEVKATAVNHQGTVEWSKINKAGEPLTDATFNILDENGEIVVEHLESDEEGNFSYKGLVPGDYTIVESSAAAGYLLNLAPMTFNIPEHAPAAVTKDLGSYENYQGSAQMMKYNEAGDTLAGATFEVRDTNDEFVQEAISDETGRVFVEGLAPGTYTFVETASPDGYITNTEPVEFTIIGENEGEPEVVTADEFINYQGRVVLKKTDVDGNPLADAVFEIKDLEGNLIEGNLISDEDGMVTAENLAPGTYNFHEVEAPAGYLINETLIEFTIDGEAAGRPVRVEAGQAVNYKGSAQLVKVDVNSTPLADATFEVRNADGTFVREVRSDEEGLVFVDELAPGDYKFVETKAPTGYLINETEIAFTIGTTALGEPVVVDAGKAINYKGSVEWTKVDENGGILPGATFNVIDADNNVVAEDVAADDEGLVKVDELAPGTYTIVETATVEGYILNTEVGTFEIADTAKDLPDTVVADNFVNYQGKVELTKTDTEGNPLADAVFTLELNGEVVEEELTTDENGNILVEGLAPGDYTFTEVSAPTGYIIDSTPITFSVAAENEGEPVLITVGDVINYQGEVSLKKVDIEGNALVGAIFELRDTDDNRLRNDITSDRNGKITVENLAPGDYVLREIKAPAGYVLNTTPIFFTIEASSNGQPAVLDLGEFINYQGTIELLKTDEDGNPLADAEFDVIDANGKKVRRGLISDKDGRIIIDGLAPGKYTLVETKAPAGYALPDGSHSFEIVAEAAGEPEVIKLTITNALEPEKPVEDSDLPKTGEAESYILLAIMLMMLGMGLGLYNKKKPE